MLLHALPVHIKVNQNSFQTREAERCVLYVSSLLISNECNSRAERSGVLHWCSHPCSTTSWCCITNQSPIGVWKRKVTWCASQRAQHSRRGRHLRNPRTTSGAQKITVSPRAGTRNSSGSRPTFLHSFLRSSGGSSTGSAVRTHVLDAHWAGVSQRQDWVLTPNALQGLSWPSHPWTFIQH